jgi:predicted dehydrogenase
MKKVKIAIIGAGYWGTNLIRNFYALENCEVKYVCDLEKSKLDKVKKNYPTILTITDARKIFNDKEIKAVAIATSTETHFSLAKQALEKGKHVFIEKPMTRTSAQAEELIKIAKKKKLIIQVDHTFLYHGPIIKIKEIIDSGELGNLFYFDSQRINLGLIQHDINVIWDLAPHDISILKFWYPEKIVSVSAIGTRHIVNKKEELAHITLKYKTGLMAHIHVSWLSPVKLRQMLIGGSKKMIYFDDIEPTEKIKIYNKGIDFRYEEDTFNPIYRSGDVAIPIYSGEEALLRGCGEFLDCIQKNKQPLISGKFGIEVVKILETTDKSLSLGGQEIPLI